MTSTSNDSIDALTSPAAWALRSFDPWDHRITYGNVWAMYGAMRRSASAVWSDAQGGFWSIARYHDVREAAADFRTFSSGQDGVVIGRSREARAMPLELDRPEHTRYRRAMQEPFMPRRVDQFTHLVRRCVADTLDRVAAAGQFDIVHDIAEKLPFQVISDFLGIPRGERQELHRRLAGDLVNADLSSMDRADDAYVDFLREEVRSRTSQATDFISELRSTTVDGRGFDDEEVARMARALALAGHHTTINGIASLLLRMAEEGNRRAYLAQPGTAAQVVEETLRIDPPIHLEARTATASTVVGGVEIPAGGRVALLYGSANRDPQVYPDPDRFDPLREGPTNLSFGHGIHKCLGAPLARMEMLIILEEMTRRFAGYRLTAEPMGTGMFLGHHMGWASIPATLDAA